MDKKSKLKIISIALISILLYIISASSLYFFYHDKGNIYIGLPLSLLALFVLVTIILHLEIDHRFKITNKTLVTSLVITLAFYMGIYAYFVKFLHPNVNNSGFQNEEIKNKLSPGTLE